MKKNSLRKITTTSIFVAMAIVISLFNPMIYFGGGAGLRISFSSLFSVVPSILFGPMYGGISMGITDVLGYVIRPTGGYLFPLTITAILGGILRGLGMKYCKPCKKVSLFIPIFILFIMIFGLFNYFISGADIAYSRLLNSLGNKKVYLSLYPLACGGLGLLLYFINKFIISKKVNDEEYSGLFFVLLIVNVIITSINTYLLMLLIPSLGKLAFSLFYIPRLFEEIVNTIVQTYVITILLNIYKKINFHN